LCCIFVLGSNDVNVQSVLLKGGSMVHHIEAGIEEDGEDLE
jgi:hypothetical protein